MTAIDRLHLFHYLCLASFVAARDYRCTPGSFAGTPREDCELPTPYQAYASRAFCPDVGSVLSSAGG